MSGSLEGHVRGVVSLIEDADTAFSAQRMVDAVRAYHQALLLGPNNVHVLHRLAQASVHLNNLDDARLYLNLALAAAPSLAELWEHAGLVAAGRGEYVRAEAFYCRALELAGSSATLHRNLGDCLRLPGRLADAKREYSNALACEPGLHAAIRAIARISSELGDSDNAADYWLRALPFAVDRLQDALDLIAALAAARRTQQLDDVVPHIIACHAGNAVAVEALCLALYKADRFTDLLGAARQGLRVDRRNVKLHHYAAHALSVQGQVSDALVHSREAVRLAPDDAVMNVQLGWLELNDSEYREGWARSNCFYTTQAARYLRVFPDAPVWNGEPVAGRTFLLVGEQGLGDQIQFIRFAQWLFVRGAVVDVLVSEPVAELAASMRSIRQVHTQLPDLAYDFSCHMQRMPEHMQFDINMLPIAMPYLGVSQNLVDAWRARLDALPREASQQRKRRVGIVWAGGGFSVLSRFQSIALDVLRPLFSRPEIAWFPIQKGECERDAEALAAEFDVHTLGPQIEDFPDTLAIMNTLDLVITVDTSVAHLAGAANLPVWVLIPAYAQWRWLQDRMDSPWYPSMRLFRQRELGQWGPVVDEVGNALTTWCATASRHESE